MSLIDRMSQLDKKFSWSFLGFVLGIIFGALTIYASFFYEKKPLPKYEIVSNTSVFDVHENIGKLDILYDGKDIKKSGQALRVLIIRVVNDGNGSILKNDYDDREPIGFVLLNGQLVKLELIDASNSYLMKAVGVTIKPRGIVTFSDVILEPKEFYLVKLLVLTNEKVKDISLQPIGKLANVKAIEVVHTYKDQEATPIWKRVFGGSLQVQAVRFLVYFVISVVLMIALIVLLITISDYREKYARKRLVSRFRDSAVIDLNKTDDALLNLFIENGPNYLKMVGAMLSDEKKLEKIAKTSKGFKNDVIDFAELATFSGDDRAPIPAEIFYLRKLIKAGIVRKDGQKVTVNSNIKQTLSSFLEYYERRTKNPRGQQ